MRTGFTALDAAEIGRPPIHKPNPFADLEYDTSGNAVQSKGAYLEVVAWDLYDSFQVAVSTKMTQVLLFTQPIGGNFTYLGSSTQYQKTILNTNLNSQGAILPNPQRFIAKALHSVTSPGMHPTDFQNLYYTSVLNFVVGDTSKSYFNELLAKVPSGESAVYAFTVGTPTGQNFASYALGWPSPQNVYHLSAGLDPWGRMDPGVPINQGQNFQVTYDPTQNVTAGSSNPYTTLAGSTTGGTGIIFWLFMAGTLARSRQ